MKKDALFSFKVSVFTDQKTYRNIPEAVQLRSLCLKHKSEIYVWNIYLYKHIYTLDIYIHVRNYSLVAKWFSHVEYSSLCPSAICVEKNYI